MARYHVILLGLLLAGQAQSQTIEDGMGNPLVTQQINAAFTGGQARALRGISGMDADVLQKITPISTVPQNILSVNVCGGVWYSLKVYLIVEMPADSTISFDLEGTADVESIVGYGKVGSRLAQGEAIARIISPSIGALNYPVNSVGATVVISYVELDLTVRFYESGTAGVFSLTTPVASQSVSAGSYIIATPLEPLFDK